jgi:hypothetical protein
MTEPAVVTLAVPCRADEPALGRTLERAHQSWLAAPHARTHALELLVCLNGSRPERPLADLRTFVAGAGLELVELGGEEAGRAPAAGPRGMAAALLCARAGKPIAWNILRRHARGHVALFLDADVAFAPETFGLLLNALAADPGAALASARTRCAPRPGLFERVMAAPYGVRFPNLSPQLYAARVAELPLAIPEDLLEPELWIALLLGHERVVRVPGAEVTVRLPATLGDFFRQRIRIEMGKVQLSHEYPGLERGAAPQPGVRDVVGSLGVIGTAWATAYLALRAAAHAVAWWRYRRGPRGNLWPQPVTTKQWGPT